MGQISGFVKGYKRSQLVISLLARVILSRAARNIPPSTAWQAYVYTTVSHYPSCCIIISHTYLLAQVFSACVMVSMYTALLSLPVQVGASFSELHYIQNIRTTLSPHLSNRCVLPKHAWPSIMRPSNMMHQGNLRFCVSPDITRPGPCARVDVIHRGC